MIGDFHEKPEGCQQNGELGSSNFLFSNRNDKLKKKKKRNYKQQQQQQPEI